jgi:hypothetical protein
LLSRPPAARKRLEIPEPFEGLMRKFPTHWNREFISVQQGIKSGHQGNYSPDQGTPPFHPTTALSQVSEQLSQRIPFGEGSCPRGTLLVCDVPSMYRKSLDQAVEFR